MASLDVTLEVSMEQSRSSRRNKQDPDVIDPVRDFHPPKFNAQRQYVPPSRGFDDSDGSVGESSRRTSRIPLEDYDSSIDSYQPSGAVSSKSSAYRTPIETPDTHHLSLNSHEFFKENGPPGRPLSTPGQSTREPQHPPRTTRVSEDNDDSEPTSRTSQTDEVVAIPQPAHQVGPVDPPVDSTPTAKAAIQESSDAQNKLDADRERGRRNILFQKIGFAFGLICLNFAFIFCSWWWPRYYYVYLPFICLPLALNCVMIASIICFKIRNTIRPEKIIVPNHVESLAMVIPCYNETYEECTRSLDSLVRQNGISDNKKAIIVICDGRVRGPGMEKTTADYLFEDIFTDQDYRAKIKQAYTGWNGSMMDVEVAKGYYKGVPYCCIVKDQNQGKRDSLIVVRSFLYKFNRRRENPGHIYSPRFFDFLCNWLNKDLRFDNVDHLIGMDADTVFDDECIWNLLKESRYPHTVGVCGYVAVDFSGGNWNIWSLYQNSEYTIAQGLRRLHQSIATKKVSCLPGCCQLLRICDTTCGDKVLVELFGYHPSPRDGMLKQIRATASEDRNHVCLMLTTFPEAQTRQALRARAYTDVPHSWSVYLSQRRRWTLGATGNDLMLVLAWHTQWWERILAFSNVLCWCLNVFIVACIASMIVAFMTQPWWIIVAFASVMIVPLAYYVIMTFWLPPTIKEKVQFLAGLFIFVVCGPFLNIFVMFYAVWNMDSFGWGKTRKVLSEDNQEKAAEDRSSSGNVTDSSNPAPAPQGLLQEKSTRRPDDDFEAAVESAVHRPTTSIVRPPPQAVTA